MRQYPESRQRLGMQGALRWLFAVGFVGIMGCTPRAEIDPAATGDVQGSFHTDVAGQTYVVAGADIYLKDDQGARAVQVQTDKRGRYLFKGVPGGYYWLCWDTPGWSEGCAPGLIRVESNINYPPSQTLVGDPEDKMRRVAGRVMLQDGASPVYRDGYFGIENDVTVIARDAVGSELGRTQASPIGTYVLSGMPGTDFEIRVEMPGFASPDMAVPAGQGDLEQAVVLDNFRPAVLSMTARPVQGPRFVIEPGETLRVTAEVADADSLSGLTYRWKPAPQNGDILPSNSGSAMWKLDPRPGPKTIYVTVEDGRGGFAMRSLSINAGLATTAFAGQVMSSSGTALVGADISVNVQQYDRDEVLAEDRPSALRAITEAPVMARTGEDGAFLLTDVPLGERYVLNIASPGHVPISRIFDNGNAFREYRMEEAFITDIDPERPVTITDERKRDDIRTHQRASVRLLDSSALQTQAEGDVAAGPVRAEIASLDLTRNEMPGDYTTLTEDGLTGLRSFGAVHVDFFDATGNALQLRDGAQAEISIAAPDGLRDRPDQVPLYFYDEATGLWERYETMARYDEETDSYIGRVDHFSSINVDAPLTDTSCVRFLSDNLSTAHGYVARFSFPSLAQTYDVPIDEALSVLRRIPPNEAGSTVTILDTTNNNAVVTDVDVYQFDFAGGQTPLPSTGSSFTFTSGAPVTGNFTLLRPYEGCQTLSARRPVSSSADFQFLQRSYGTGSDALTQGYYGGLDPAMTFANNSWSGGTHATLGDWWAASGFSNTGVPLGTASPGVIDRANAAYMNYNDLGFGRNMTIRKDSAGSADRVFAYVSNHADIQVNGGANQNPLNAAFARLGTNGFATVVMESTLVNGTENVVTFFVYGGTDASAPLINSADLDGYGQKFVPGLCQVCHGGAVYAPGNVAAPTPAELSLRPSPNGIGASLREFDLESYLFEPATQGPSNLSPAQEAEFFKLNQLVKDSRPQPNIVDLIDGWYGGVALNAGGTALVGTPDYEKAPTGWQSSTTAEAFYTDVIAKSCRTCHIAFDGNGSANDISWHSEVNFQNSEAFSEFLVCDINSGNLMPHALMTYRNFWLEGMGPPYEPDAFEAYTGQSCN